MLALINKSQLSNDYHLALKIVYVFCKRSLCFLNISVALTLLCISSINALAYVILPPECQAENEGNCIKNHSLDYIFIYQTISVDEYRFFKKLDDNWDDKIPLPPIFLESGGGDTWNSFYVGRILRKRHATVYTGNPISKLDRAECASACVFIAAGAERRFLSGIGLHHGVMVEYHGRQSPIYKDLDSDVDAEVRDYLREMKIDDEVNNLIIATPTKNIHLIYHIPEHPLADQLIYRLGFRMDPHFEEEKNIFPRYVRDEQGYELSKIRFAAYNKSSGAIDDLIKQSVSIADGKEPDFKSAIYWSEIGVKAGYPVLIYNYGVALGNGHYGITDKLRATDLYKLAAQKGLGPAQNNLGWHYYMGDGVEKNIPLAVYWITQAAAQDNNFAYGSLCEMHGAGDVFPRDDLEAFKWCQLAISNMPAGKARSASEEVLESLSNRMNDRQISRASESLLDWVPLKNGGGMMNVEDW